MPVFPIDQLREATVRIIKPDGQTAGAGFIIRADGYLITCHHVIYQLEELRVECQGKIYESEWCEDLSNPEVDMAVLHIDLTGARPVPIINPREFSSPVKIFGFPESKAKNFPKGYEVEAQDIQPSPPINTRSTYPSLPEVNFGKSWNRLPRPEATFLSHRVNEKVESGCSGGPVFSEAHGGVVGVMQCTGSKVSYAIRWDNIKDILDKLGLEPEKNAVCAFLEDIEKRFQYMPLFHEKQQVVIEDQYVPIQVTLERRYRHEVETSWGYAESEEDFKRVYAMKGIAGEEEEKHRLQLPWEQARKEHQWIMVLADPGMGKSTLLRLEARRTAQTSRQRLVQGQATVADVEVPIFLRLSELEREEGEIAAALPRLLHLYHPETFPGVAHLLAEKLASGSCLLLLDALDEVPLEDRQGLAEKLSRFVRRFANCPVICTSRLVGYPGGFLEGAKEVEIVPFGDKEIDRFIHAWFANAAPLLEGKPVSAPGLIRELRSKPQIQGLSQNPLLLSLLCSLYQEEELTLPARRVEIYEQALRLILGKWRQQKFPQTETRITAKTIMLEALAYQLSCEGKEIFSDRDLFDKITRLKARTDLQEEFKVLTPSDLITDLAEKDGIIQKLSREESRYIFLHRTFQEYLTASYLKDIMETNEPRGIALAKEHFWDYDWHETLALLAGRLANPLPLLQAIMATQDDIFRSMLLLACRCLAECRENSSPECLEIIGRTYAHWQTDKKANHELGWFEPVIISLGHTHSFLRRKLYRALQDIFSFCYACVALGKIGSPEAIPALNQALRDHDRYVRMWAADAFGEIGSPKSVPALLLALKDQYYCVRLEAAMALGRIGSPEAVPALTQAIKDQHFAVRSNSAKALGRIGSPEAVPALLLALKDRDYWVRRQAAEVLGKIGTLEILPQLLEDPEIDFSNKYILSLARKLAIRYSKSKTNFIPLYPEVFERYRGQRTSRQS